MPQAQPGGPAAHRAVVGRAARRGDDGGRLDQGTCLRGESKPAHVRRTGSCGRRCCLMYGQDNDVCNRFPVCPQNLACSMFIGGAIPIRSGRHCESSCGELRSGHQYGSIRAHLGGKLARSRVTEACVFLGRTSAPHQALGLHWGCPRPSYVFVLGRPAWRHCAPPPLPPQPSAGERQPCGLPDGVSGQRRSGRPSRAHTGQLQRRAAAHTRGEPLPRARKAPDGIVANAVIRFLTPCLWSERQLHHGERCL